MASTSSCAGLFSSAAATVKPLQIQCPLFCGLGFVGTSSASLDLFPFGALRTRARLSSFTTVIIPQATSATAVEGEGNRETDTVPTPKVIIDQDADPDATVVEITFGDRLGALLDTMNALKNLGLNVTKASVFLDSSGKHNKFAITKADTGRKIESPELLEAIRLTIINNLLEYHPESSAQLAMGVAFGVSPPKQQVDVDIATHVRVYSDGPSRSLLSVETADRPGLLVDLVKMITDISIAVESGEFDTEGLLAKAKFHVSYRGGPVSKSLELGNRYRSAVALAPHIASLALAPHAIARSLIRRLPDSIPPSPLPVVSTPPSLVSPGSARSVAASLLGRCRCLSPQLLNGPVCLHRLRSALRRPHSPVRLRHRQSPQARLARSPPSRPAPSALPQIRHFA